MSYSFQGQSIIPAPFEKYNSGKYSFQNDHEQIERGHYHLKLEENSDVPVEIYQHDYTQQQFQSQNIKVEHIGLPSQEVSPNQMKQEIPNIKVLVDEPITYKQEYSSELQNQSKESLFKHEQTMKLENTLEPSQLQQLKLLNLISSFQKIDEQIAQIFDQSNLKDMSPFTQYIFKGNFNTQLINSRKDQENCISIYEESLPRNGLIRFEVVSPIIEKIFKTQNQQIPQNLLNQNEITLIESIFKKKFQFKDKFQQQQLETINVPFNNKRPFENRQLVYRSAYKFLLKKMGNCETKFYEHYFKQVSESLNIEFTKFYHPLRKINKQKEEKGQEKSRSRSRSRSRLEQEDGDNHPEKKSNEKQNLTITLTFLNLQFQSSIFREDINEFVENIFIQQYKQQREHKIRILIECNNKRLINNQGIESNSKEKIPWSDQELEDAKIYFLKLINDTIKIKSYDKSSTLNKKTSKSTPEYL